MKNRPTKIYTKTFDRCTFCPIALPCEERTFGTMKIPDDCPLPDADAIDPEGLERAARRMYECFFCDKEGKVNCAECGEPICEECVREPDFAICNSCEKVICPNCSHFVCDDCGQTVCFDCIQLLRGYGFDKDGKEITYNVCFDCLKPEGGKKKGGEKDV
jgi:hypothetical protein